LASFDDIEGLPTCEEAKTKPYFGIAVDGIILEETSMEQVKGLYGEAKETVYKVEECCLQRSVCYLSPDRSLAFDVGGFAEGKITSFEITRDAQQLAKLKHCARSAKLNVEPRTTLGIALGMGKHEVLKRLGPPRKLFSLREDEIEYSFECKRTDVDPGGWLQRHTYIRVRFATDNTVVGYSISQGQN
jgi:hypothetical protein